MKLLVVGGSGALGRELVRQATTAGHRVTVVVRQAGSAPPATREVVGDVLQAGSLPAAVRGQDAVISALGMPATSQQPILSEGTRHVIEAMEDAGVRRLVVVTAFGVGDSRADYPWPLRVVAGTLISRPFADKERQERIITGSGLDWTLVRPITLTNGRRTSRYRVAERLPVRPWSRISRADVAEFMLRQLDDRTFVRRSVSISY